MYKRQIKVTAEDGSVKTYTVKIEKEKQEEVKKSNDATLKKLDISGYTLTPTFKSNVCLLYTSNLNY